MYDTELPIYILNHSRHRDTFGLAQYKSLALPVTFRLQAAQGVRLPIIYPYLSRQDTKTVYLQALFDDDSYERFLVVALPRNDKQH